MDEALTLQHYQQQQQLSHSSSTKRVEMILLMQQQQRSSTSTSWGDARLQTTPAGAPDSRPTVAMSPTRSSAASLYSSSSSVAGQSLLLGLSAVAGYM